MRPRQISVFVENRTGRIGEVTQVLGKAGVNIRAVSLADTHDFGIVRLIVNDVDRAMQILRQEKFTVMETEVIAVEIPDEPGALSGILELLGTESVNVEYLYGFTEIKTGRAILIFRFEETMHAVKVLEAKGVKMLDGNTLHGM
ncbi:MAG: ACT domain-containing protein [bacterium]|nr:ACT domain-containing protein [bacterium]